MATLITGGAGFIGSRLAAALQARGEPVVILDNFNDYYDPALKHTNVLQFKADPHVTIVTGDIRDAALIADTFARYDIRRVAHLAAMGGVRKSVGEPILYFDVNLTGTLYLLEAARQHQIEQFVLASTSSVYGKTQRLPFVEDDTADRPLAPYPASKRAAEIAAHSYHHLHKLNITCLRFFNVYGPHGRPDMMPIKVIQAVCDDHPITLFNAGDLSRDWTYIDDIVAGVVAALDRPMGYEIINLGCGSPISMRQFVDYIEQLSQKKIERINVLAPASEPPITYCDNSRARRLLDFVPTVSVKEGLARTWEWYTRNGHAYR
ncbi:MAG: GDP-mannose 4,6-dehydratase [Anaerolineae bacterium]|nr:GDP-mannose 4,6-dehydratase [Anaerolineae bacterium]